MSFFVFISSSSISLSQILAELWTPTGLVLPAASALQWSSYLELQFEPEIEAEREDDPIQGEADPI